MMTSTSSLQEQAWEHYRAGELQPAERTCRDILRLEPLHAEAKYLLGVMALDAGQQAQAVLHFQYAAELRPDHAAFRHALGEAYRIRGETARAVECFRTVLAVEPTFAVAHHGLGRCLLDQGELDAAIASLRQSLSLDPNQPRVLTNLGRALHRRGDLDGAADSFREAIRLKPNYAIAHNNLGGILQAQGRLDAAAACFRRALTLEPDYAEAHYNLGQILLAQNNPKAAADYLHAAIQRRPEYARAHFVLGQARATMWEFAAALECYRAAVKLDPHLAEAYLELGRVLQLKRDWDGAQTAFERALAIQPEDSGAFCQWFSARQMLCDWHNRDADLHRLWEDASAAFEAGKPTSLQPFTALTVPWSPQQQLQVARSHSDAIARAAVPLRERFGFIPRPPTPTADERLRIGYLSGDFRNHPVSHLLQGVFGLHDRQKFEVFAYSFGMDDGSSCRQRIARDCDCFRDLREASLEESARCIYEDRLHILLDLQGYSSMPRMSLLALRPAPVQVEYLGYPGTTGADFIDYLIGDPVVTPPQQHAAYREAIVLLPHSYLPTDNGMPLPSAIGSRTDHNLPENAVVFCAFNNSYKLEPERFGIWMRILKAVPDSVLWLSPATPRAQSNLRRAAQTEGVAGERLIFADEMDKPRHVARNRLADLFLDTGIYNGHMTACDALWAGLPVLTCPGRNFAARVAASLLTSIGMPELIAADANEYEALAIRLARQPVELKRLRAKLTANRLTWPLFDTPRYTRNLERAYQAMWDNYAAGKSPRPITVLEPVAVSAERTSVGCHA